MQAKTARPVLNFQTILDRLPNVGKQINKNHGYISPHICTLNDLNSG